MVIGTLTIQRCVVEFSTAKCGLGVLSPYICYIAHMCHVIKQAFV